LCSCHYPSSMNTDYLFNSTVDFMANAIAQTLLAKRTHKVAGRDKSRAMQFKNGRYLSQCPER
jgi:hypothetical protein